MITPYQQIEKEKINTLQFPQSEVLHDQEAIVQRNLDLVRAQSLGNLEHAKIKIFFEDNQSKKMVETTVWAVTDKQVILKQGVGIPIHRIYKSA